MLLGEVVKYILDKMPSLLIHLYFESVHKLEPVYKALIVVKGLPESG